MTEKIFVNPALIEALDHYASYGHDFNDPSTFVYRDEDGRHDVWTAQRACVVAHEIASKEGIKKYGMERLYEQIMGESL